MTINEIASEVNRSLFIKNGMFTLIFIYNIQLPFVLATLVTNSRNNLRGDYKTKSDFVRYLRDGV